MKIITDNAAYLQKYYFGILLESTYVTEVGVPISICDVPNKKAFNKYDSKDFIKFTKKEEIDFLKNAQWIPNFTDYIKKSVEEINKEIEIVDNEVNILKESFKKLMEEEHSMKSKKSFTEVMDAMNKQTLLRKTSIEAKMLMYKKESLNDILALKEKNMNPVLEEKGLIRKLQSILHR